MTRYMLVLATLGMIGTACAAPDPVLIAEPEVTPAQVAVVEEVAEEEIGETARHEDEDGMQAEEHGGADTHREDSEQDDHGHDVGEEAMAGSAAGGDFDVEVEVAFSEFSIEADAMAFAPGQTVRFRLRNEGELDHEFRLSNQHRIDEHIAAGHDDHGDEDGHHGSTGDVIVLLPAGTSQIVDVTFPDEAETYTMVVCLLPGHYEAGMKAPIEFTS